MRGESRLFGPALAVLAATTLIGALLATSAGAEVAQKGGVRVSVEGRINPNTLPRQGRAPVAVSVSGHIAATEPGQLPKLQRIAIAINSHGQIQSRGIPICRLGHIDPSTTQEALEACGPSLVGEGHFSADVKIPEQSPFPAAGRVLAFNGKLGGKPAILAHIYGTKPVPTSYVLSFLIEPAKGTYGTVIRASLPHVTGEWGYVTGVSLRLDRSYLAAGCPAPSGFSRASFPLMKTSFSFAGGLSLTSTLNRSCKVKQ